MFTQTVPPGATARAMDLERYNRLFEEHVVSVEEEAEARLQAFRQRHIHEYINRLTRQQSEWEETFRELLKKSQEAEIAEQRNVSFAEKPSIRIIDGDQPPIQVKPLSEAKTTDNQKQPDIKHELSKGNETTVSVVERPTAPTSEPTVPLTGGDKLTIDPFPRDAQDYFTNSLAVKEFIRIQKQQETNRKLLHELNTSNALKPYKNELNLFIRTQINSISNSDIHHMNSKTRLLTSLFQGQTVNFQDRQISVTKHPQGQLLAMDLASQTFVAVGTRLVNSVPAIAKSMATVINGVINAGFPLFKDLIIGHLQERCPYLVPMYPHRADFGNQIDSQTKYKIACGYSNDIKTQALESEEKYLARMRSMTLIFACIIIQQDNKGPAWSWLVSYLSLKPEPVITATVLQAFLQETSRMMSMTYRKQYRKLLAFLQSDYVKMIEEVTKLSERQSLIKLKNQLAEDYKDSLVYK